MMEHAMWGSCDIPILLLGRYQYEALIAGTAVRILHLEPANDFQSPLRGFITQDLPSSASIDPNFYRYSAVSYTWGDPRLSHKLFLRLETRWSLLSITKSVDLLLRYLRDTHEEIALWIDSICLNQKDQGEKAQQIPLMGQIYADAEKVHIWLGDDEMKDARQAFSLMRRIACELEGGEKLPSENDFRCLERFFNRPWFTRRWIIQEIFFAQDAVFHCGYDTLSLSCVMAVLAKANDFRWSELPGWGSEMLRSSIGNGHTCRQDLLSLLWDLHESECSDNRDRVAAIYTMADDLSRPPLQYEIGDWKRMFMGIASYYLNNDPLTGRTLLFHLCDFGSIKPGKNYEIPSWVPNWSTKRQEVIPFHVLGSWLEYFHENRISVPDSFRMPSWWHPDSMNPWKKKLALFQWKSDLKTAADQAIMKLGVSGFKLRVNYDFFTFIYGCGTVDHVVCPALSPALSDDFWEEIVGLLSWREKRLDVVKRHFKGNNVMRQADMRHKIEVESLSSLLISILAGRDSRLGYRSSHLRERVRGLCAGLYVGRGDGNRFQNLTEGDREVLRSIRSAVQNMAILRVQATLGYYWAIGPANLVKGDWFIPIIAYGERVPRRPEALITRSMCLRPIRAQGQRSTWYPSTTSNPAGRRHRLVAGGLKLAKIDSVHITATFSGTGGSCLHSFDYNLRNDTVLWRVLRQATKAAMKKGLPGPIIFDII